MAKRTLLNAFLFGSILCSGVAGQEQLVNGDFESGVEGWVPVGPVTLESDATLAHEGCCALKVLGRTSDWNGVGQFITEQLVPGRSYSVRGWVRLLSGEADQVSIKYRKIDGSGTEWILLAQGTARADEWREFVGAFTHEPVGDVESLRFYVSGPQPGIGFMVDGLSISELESDWESAANDRIRELRTRSVRVEVVDQDGCPVPGALVESVQERRSFGFGTAINRNHMSNTTYTEFVAENFEWAVMENAAKWRQNQNSAGPPDYSDADAMVQFCLENDLRMRGHCVFWANPLRVPDWVQPLTGTALETAISDRIESVIPRYAEVFEHWDVNNEMITNRFFADRLGEGIRSQMFQRVRARDADVTLFVNDFSILTSNRQTELLQQVEALEADGATVDAIGAQGHFPTPPTGAVVLQRLDNLARASKPIWITEFDCPAADETRRADALETVYRAAFSHPSVEGILMWGFWAGSLNNGPDAALVDLDWSLTESGVRYQALMDEWSTETSGSTDPTGGFEFRAYHGRHSVSVALDGVLHEGLLELVAGDGVFTQRVVLDLKGACTVCLADLNRDLVIDGADLAQLLGGWGAAGATDLDGSGATDGADLARLLGEWGANCGP
ncbi:MAG: endo-1,4-beta-xylanase [Planctomycetota bacterium]|nr:endo-1,4-beta-xylanase [Planctomycetota bacterium]